MVCFLISDCDRIGPHSVVDPIFGGLLHACLTCRQWTPGQLPHFFGLNGPNDVQYLHLHAKIVHGLPLIFPNP